MFIVSIYGLLITQWDRIALLYKKKKKQQAVQIVPSSRSLEFGIFGVATVLIKQAIKQLTAVSDLV